MGLEKPFAAPRETGATTNPLAIEIRDAQGQLPDLIARAVEGQAVVLTRDGMPIARLLPIRLLHASRVAARHAGQVWMSDDFDAPVPEMLR